MNQANQTIYDSSSVHLVNELNFQLKFNLFGSWIKFNELIIKSNSEFYSSWLGSLLTLLSNKKQVFTKKKASKIGLSKSQFPTNKNNFFKKKSLKKE